MRKEISLETHLKSADFYYENNLTQEQKKQYERFEEWFQWCSADAAKEFFNFEDNFAKIIESEHNLENFTTEQLIAELQKRTDMMFVGNFYDKEHIMELCGANEMEAESFIEDCNPGENDAVLENADLELQALFENWQDENDQYLPEQKEEYIQVDGERISKKVFMEELEGYGTVEQIEEYIKNACLDDFYGDETYTRHFSRWLETNTNND